VLARHGRPLEVLEDLLAMPEFAGAEYLGASDQIPLTRCGEDAHALM